ncbi:MAG: DUF4124 domain-containing protein [Comamonas sp.]
MLAATALLAVPAQAQVLRCTDPASGRVTYTDGECAPGTAVKEVERRKSDDELAQEQARADQALRRQAERRAQDQEQQRLDLQEKALQAEANRRAAASNGSYRPPEPQGYRDGSGLVVIDGYDYGYRPHIHPPRPPVSQGPAPAIRQCDVFKCVDANGNTHPRAGIGEGPPPGRNPPGKVTCRSRGGTAPC